MIIGQIVDCLNYVLFNEKLRSFFLSNTKSVHTFNERYQKNLRVSDIFYIFAVYYSKLLEAC